MRQGFRRALMRDTGTGAGEDDTTDESQGESVLLVKHLGRRKHQLLHQLNIYTLSPNRGSGLARSADRSGVVRWSSVRSLLCGRAYDGTNYFVLFRRMTA